MTREQNTVKTTPPVQHIALSLWFDMQPDAHIRAPVPKWTREVAQAHADKHYLVLAHQDSSYAQSGLLCQVVDGALWLDDAWEARIRTTLDEARAQGCANVLIILPYRASPAVWMQWALVNLSRLQAGLDNTTGLLQGHAENQQAFTREDAHRWLPLDRIITYGDGVTTDEWMPVIRQFNPLIRWLHDEFLTQSVLQTALNAHHKNIPLARSPIKNSDLDAWGVNKVVYFALSKPLDNQKVAQCMVSWQEKYGTHIARLWASLRIQGQNDPVLVSGIHYLFASYRAQQMPNNPVTESRVWAVGEGLDAAAMQAELAQCYATE